MTVMRVPIEKIPMKRSGAGTTQTPSAIAFSRSLIGTVYPLVESQVLRGKKSWSGIDTRAAQLRASW